jgi:hypothetical protein
VFQLKLKAVCLAEFGLPRTHKFIHCPRLPPIDPSTWTRRTPRIDPPPTTSRAPSVDPPPATTRRRSAPSVDPNPSVGLWRVCKPSAADCHRRNGRTGPFSHAPEKQAPVQRLLFLLGSCRFRCWFIIHSNRLFLRFFGQRRKMHGGDKPLPSLFRGG